MLSAALFAVGLVGVMLRRSPLVILLSIFYSFFYVALLIPLCVTCLSVALLWRNADQRKEEKRRALAPQPPMLVADEPTGNLDLETAWQVMTLLQDVSRFGTAVLVATHNVEIVKRLQRRVLTLVEGRLVRDQPAGRVGRLAWAVKS